MHIPTENDSRIANVPDNYEAIPIPIPSMQNGGGMCTVVVHRMRYERSVSSHRVDGHRVVQVQRYVH